MILFVHRNQGRDGGVAEKLDTNYFFIIYPLRTGEGWDMAVDVHDTDLLIIYIIKTCIYPSHIKNYNYYPHIQIEMMEPSYVLFLFLNLLFMYSI